MKKSVLISMLIFTGAVAQAKTTTEVMSGAAAIKALEKTGILDGEFSGDDCQVVKSSRGHNLEISGESKGRKVIAMDLFEDTKYKVSTKEVDGSFTSIETLDGQVKITLLYADDAFYNVKLQNHSQKFECEVDM